MTTEDSIDIAIAKISLEECAKLGMGNYTFREIARPSEKGWSNQKCKVKSVCMAAIREMTGRTFQKIADHLESSVASVHRACKKTCIEGNPLAAFEATLGRADEVVAMAASEASSNGDCRALDGGTEADDDFHDELLMPGDADASRSFEERGRHIVERALQVAIERTAKKWSIDPRDVLDKSNAANGMRYSFEIGATEIVRRLMDRGIPKSRISEAMGVSESFINNLLKRKGAKFIRLDTVIGSDLAGEVAYYTEKAASDAYVLMRGKEPGRTTAIMRGFAEPTVREKQAIAILSHLGLPDLSIQVVSQSSAGQAVDLADTTSGYLTKAEREASNLDKFSWKDDIGRRAETGKAVKRRVA